MARGKSPQMSGNAAASVGVSVNWFQDVAGPRARARPRPRGAASSRQRAIRVVNQVVWDRFPTLPAAQRQEWAAWARRVAARRAGRYWIHPAQHVYTGLNIIPYDQRGAIYDDPPWSDAIIQPSSLAVFRDPGTGTPAVACTWPPGTPLECLLDVWECHRWPPPAPRAVRPPWRHVAYLPAISGVTLLPLDPGPHYLIGIRPVSVRGLTWRTFRPFVLE